MPKSIEFDDANAYIAVLVLLGLGLLPATLLFCRKLLRHGLFVPAAVPNRPLRPRALRSASARMRQNAVQIFLLLLLIFLWVVFVWLYLQIEATTHMVYDPLEVLGLQMGATQREIKKAYRSLSREHHPDKGGDPEEFVKISSAYEALTDPEAIENMQQYGHPDGPQEMGATIALPSFLVSEEHQVAMLFGYIVAFMFIAPALAVRCCLTGPRPIDADDLSRETFNLFVKYSSEGDDKQSNGEPPQQPKPGRRRVKGKMPKRKAMKKRSKRSPPFPACFVPMLADVAGRNFAGLSRHNPLPQDIVERAVRYANELWNQEAVQRQLQIFSSLKFDDEAESDARRDELIRACYIAATSHLSRHGLPVTNKGRYVASSNTPDGDEDETKSSTQTATLNELVERSADLIQFRDVLLQDCAATIFQAMMSVFMVQKNTPCITITLRCVQCFAQGTWDEEYLTSGVVTPALLSAQKANLASEAGSQWAGPAFVASAAGSVFTLDGDSAIDGAASNVIYEADTTTLKIDLDISTQPPRHSDSGAGSDRTVVPGRDVHTFMKPVVGGKETIWAIVEDSNSHEMVAVLQTQVATGVSQSVSVQQSLTVPHRPGRSWGWNFKATVMSATYIGETRSISFSAFVRKMRMS